MNDAKELLVQEVALIKLEVQDELRKAQDRRDYTGHRDRDGRCRRDVADAHACPGAGRVHGDSALGVLRHRGERAGRLGRGVCSPRAKLPQRNSTWSLSRRWKTGRRHAQWLTEQTTSDRI